MHVNKTARQEGTGSLDRITQPFSSYPGSSTTRTEDMWERYSNKDNAPDKKVDIQAMTGGLKDSGKTKLTVVLPKDKKMNKAAHVLNTVLFGICKHAEQTLNPPQPDTDIPFGIDQGIGGLRYSNIGSALDRASKRKMENMMLNLYKGPRDEAARLATHELAKEYVTRGGETPEQEQSATNILAENLGMWGGALAGGAAGTGLGLAYRESFPEALKPLSPLVGAIGGVFAPIFIGAFLATIKKRNAAQQVQYDQSRHLLSNLLVPGRAVYNDLQRVKAGTDVLKSLSRGR